MKKIFCVLVLCNLAIIGWSQNLVVAVTDFNARSGYTSDELSDITELFAGFLRDTGAARVVTRSQWEAILGEHRFQRGGLVAQEEIRQLGRALGAQAVITGTLMKLGNSNVLNLSLLDVVTGEMLSAARSSFDSLDDFLRLLPNLSNDVMKQISNPNLLIGTWTGKNDYSWKSLSITFRNDGTFSIAPYSRRVRWSTGTVNIPKHVIAEFSGEVRGTYTYTKDDIILNWTFSGSIEAIERHTIKENVTDRQNLPNVTQQGSNTVNYKLSANGRNLEISVTPLFCVSGNSESELQLSRGNSQGTITSFTKK